MDSERHELAALLHDFQQNELGSDVGLDIARAVEVARAHHQLPSGRASGASAPLRGGQSFGF